MNRQAIHPSLLLGALAGSSAAHAVVVLFALHLSPPPARPRLGQEVEITVVDEPPPAPPPAAAPAPLAPVLPAIHRPALRRSAPPPPADRPPPPAHEAPSETPPPIVMAGVPLSATSTAGAVSAGLGNTLRGAPAGRPADPTAPRPYKAERYAESYALTEEPVFLDNVPAERVRRFYPEEARRAKEEAAVQTKLTIDDDGTVVKVVVVSAPGGGFAAAAEKLARLYRFKPARVDGHPVATEIPFTIRFELD
jgi:protein TonB